VGRPELQHLRGFVSLDADDVGGVAVARDWVGVVSVGAVD